MMQAAEMLIAKKVAHVAILCDDWDDASLNAQPCRCRPAATTDGTMRCVTPIDLMN